VKYILSREIRQEELQNKVVIVRFAILLRGKILEKAMHHKVLKTKRFEIYLLLLSYRTAEDSKY
jgi:hypothetical protein